MILGEGDLEVVTVGRNSINFLTKFAGDILEDRLDQLVPGFRV